jgi:hypothetical protein
MMKVNMTLEERIARLEFNVDFVMSRLKEVPNDIRSLEAQLKKSSAELYSFKFDEFYPFRTEVAKEFGSVRVDIGSVRVDMIRGSKG